MSGALPGAWSRESGIFQDCKHLVTAPAYP